MSFTTSPKTKIFQASLDSDARIMVSENEAVISGNSQNFLVADSRGITIRGPESHISMGLQRRKGGFWVEELEFTNMIPKTIVTPFPCIYPLPPMQEIVSIGAMMAFCVGYVAGQLA